MGQHILGVFVWGEGRSLFGWLSSYGQHPCGHPFIGEPLGGGVLMARPGLTKHRKFGRLVRLLGSKYVAMGVLECLWEPCYESGDDHVGTAEDIAFSVGWPKNHAAKLAGALHESGFVDSVGDGEYKAHDLFDHAPEYVKRRHRREAERKVRGTDFDRRASDRLVTDQSTVSDRSVDGHDRSLRYSQTGPVITPAPSTQHPAPSTRSQHSSKSGPSASGQVANDGGQGESLWDCWRRHGLAHGAKQPLGTTAGENEHVRMLLASYTREELEQAMAVWWASPFTGGRQLGMFRSQIGEVLEYLASGSTAPYRTRTLQPLTVDDGGDAWIKRKTAELAAKKAMP